MKALEEFGCRMYHPNKAIYHDINAFRGDYFRHKFQPGASDALSNSDCTDFILLPPCRASLWMHIVCVKYQALIWSWHRVLKQNFRAQSDMAGRETNVDMLRYHTRVAIMLRSSSRANRQTYQLQLQTITESSLT